VGSLKLRILLAFSAALGSVVLAAPRTALRRLRGVALAGVVVLVLGFVLGPRDKALALVSTEARRFLASDEAVRYKL